MGKSRAAQPLGSAHSPLAFGSKSTLPAGCPVDKRRGHDAILRRAQQQRPSGDNGARQVAIRSDLVCFGAKRTAPQGRLRLFVTAVS
jgi:hypothetical protein